MTLREKITEIASRWASLAARNGFDDVKWSEATAACARTLQSALADTADAAEAERAKRARNEAEARERAAIEDGQRLAAEVANLRDEVASWRKGVEDANRIAQRERADADTLRHVAETVSTRAHGLADRVQALEARRFLLERKLAQGQRWIRDAAETRERDAKPFPVVFDHACAECIPHGELVKPGFRCAVHEARTAAPATTTTKEQSHG
jgi:chromosome segregation ATPase